MITISNADIGMVYELIRSRRRTLSVRIKDGKLVVSAPLHTSEAEIERFLLKHKRWIAIHLAKETARQEMTTNAPKLTATELSTLTRQAAEVIPARVRYYAPIVGVTYGKVTIRLQKSRWGSCSTKGNLSFNCLLMLAPSEVLDSIVVHELCHRKQMNHSARFYSEVLCVYPDYYKHRKWLKENGALLMGRVDR